MSILCRHRAALRGLFCGLGLLCCAYSPVLAAPRRQVAHAKTAFVLGQGRVLAPGIVWNEVRLKSGAGVMRLWIYRPAEAQIAGAQKFPVVFIAPAGTPLYFGNRVGSGSMPEHLPYARAGFIVVAYDIDGDVAQSDDAAQTEAGTREFIAANAGINNGVAAINFALASVPRVDARRLYVAGHSSAGTLALQMAQADSRVAACVAYAPCTDIPARLGMESLMYWEKRIPGFTRFAARFSPKNNAARLRCPTFLFHADDDFNVPLSDNYAFALAVQKTNRRLVLARVKSGNHYNSMIQQGIPWAIRWLQNRPETVAAPKARKR